ncbi:MAG: tetratricopeptide repeat protein [Bacteroides sp.]|nr:tetratricopeptide repeat protein [Bacteroides sp.]
MIISPYFHRRCCARYIIIFIATLLLLTAYGCKSKTGDLLENIDQVLKEKPDSALSMIECISPAQLTDDGEKAFYALLLTEARYMTDHVQTDDSIISIATTYYHLQDQNPLRARAYYQKGMIHTNAAEYSSAFLALMLAEETALAINDTRQLALIHRSMADTFDHMENPKTAVDYYTQSYEEFRAVNDTVYAYDELYDIARANYNATNYQTALDTLQVLLPKTEAFREQAPIPYILKLMGDSYTELGKYNEAIHTFTRLHDEYPANMTSSSWNNLGLAYLNLGDIVKAEECEDSIKGLTETPSWLSYRLADVKHDYPKALTLLKAEYQDDNNFLIEWVSRSAEKELLDHYTTLKETTNMEKKARAMRMTLLGIILILLAIIVYITIHRLRSKNIKLINDNEKLTEDNVVLNEERQALTEEMAANNVIIDQLKESIDHQNTEIICMRATLLTLNEEKTALTKEISIKKNQNQQLQSRLTEAELLASARETAIVETRKKMKDALSLQSDLIDQLVKEYYDLESRKLPKNKVLDKFTEILKGLRHDNKILHQLESSVNFYLDNLMNNFRNDYPNLNDYEYDLFLFLVLEFSSKAVSVFQDTSKENFYNRKSKLIKKIQNGNTEIIAARYLNFIQ